MFNHRAEAKNVDWICRDMPWHVRILWCASIFFAASGHAVACPYTLGNISSAVSAVAVEGFAEEAEEGGTEVADGGGGAVTPAHRAVGESGTAQTLDFAPAEVCHGVTLVDAAEGVHVEACAQAAVTGGGE